MHEKSGEKGMYKFMTEVMGGQSPQMGEGSQIEQATTGLGTIRNESKLELQPSILQSVRKPQIAVQKSHRNNQSKSSRVVLIKNYQTVSGVPVTNQEMQTSTSHNQTGTEIGIKNEREISRHNKKKSARSSSAENFEEFNSDQQIRTPISQMNFGVALPKIDIKKLNDYSLLSGAPIPMIPGVRSKSNLRQAAIVGSNVYDELQGGTTRALNRNPSIGLSLIPAIQNNSMIQGVDTGNTTSKRQLPMLKTNIGSSRKQIIPINAFQTSVLSRNQGGVSGNLRQKLARGNGGISSGSMFSMMSQHNIDNTISMLSKRSMNNQTIESIRSHSVARNSVQPQYSSLQVVNSPKQMQKND
ncbi:hypothetical protein FGO68_gene2995 [Halteria grandinella]|uniref:Uncharacterized protein n=1 Tax=Halteria grandinella TaxID=5974 RepID=A0A8J8NZG0_HALGN|nr:hypothetical protein FGO68_gene2995 [Halteria grandinella]